LELDHILFFGMHAHLLHIAPCRSIYIKFEINIQSLRSAKLSIS
jgi:hypothetical protein